MAAGLGFKTFTTGEVLTAADTNGYLMQGVLVFASEAARDAAITSPQEGQFAYTKDNNSLWYYTGSAWAASGATGDIEGVTAGTGISGGGTSGTVTITNSMATEITAKADLIVGTGNATFDNLPVGTNGDVLTADSTVSPTGLKWAAPAGGSSGLTLIQRSSFSAVANTGTTFDDVFTSTYSSYLVILETFYAVTGSDAPQFQLRYAGPTTMAVQYLGSTGKLSTSGTVSWIDNYDETEFALGDEIGNDDFPGGGQIFFNLVGNASERATWRGQYLGGQNAGNFYFAGNQYNAQTYTGLLFKSSSSNITGTIAVYGMAKS
jgi:hypothetical protein